MGRCQGLAAVKSSLDAASILMLGCTVMLKGTYALSALSDGLWCLQLDARATSTKDCLTMLKEHMYLSALPYSLWGKLI